MTALLYQIEDAIDAFDTAKAGTQDKDTIDKLEDIMKTLQRKYDLMKEKLALQKDYLMPMFNTVMSYSPPSKDSQPSQAGDHNWVYPKAYSHRVSATLYGSITVLASLSVHSTAYAGFYTGQSFNAPIESGTAYGSYINTNYGVVTNAVWGSNLMKAAFFAVMFYQLIRLGFGAKGSLLEAGKYILF